MDIYLNYNTKKFIDNLSNEEQNILSNYLYEKIKTNKLNENDLINIDNIINLYKLSKVLFIRESVENNSFYYIFYPSGSLKFLLRDGNISNNLKRINNEEKFLDSNKIIIKNEMTGFQYLENSKNIKISNVFIDNLETNIRLDLITTKNYFKDNFCFLSKNYWIKLCEKHSIIINY